MNRGSASFTTMKGFMGDFVAKGDGHEEETLPLDTGADITETAELDDAQVNAPKAANIKKSDNKPGDPTTTMSEEVKEVEAGAEEDIADSYVSDVQHLPGPGDRVKKGLGYEDFNNMVAKGHVVQVSSGMNVHNVHDTMGLVQKAAMEDFDLLAREASPYTMKGMQDLSYDGGFEDLTVGKGLSSLVYKGDTEDMSLEDGYTEDSDSSPEYTEESDDDKETQGMNEPSPQTSESEAKADAASGAENPEEAEAEDEEPIEDEASSDNTTDALGKGWMAYERNFVGKGFQVQAKGGGFLSLLEQKALIDEDEAKKFKEQVKKERAAKAEARAVGKAKALPAPANPGSTAPTPSKGSQMWNRGKHLAKQAYNNKWARRGGAAGLLLGGGALGHAALSGKEADGDMMVFKGASYGEMVTKANGIFGESIYKPGTTSGKKGDARDAYKRSGTQRGGNASAADWDEALKNRKSGVTSPQAGLKNPGGTQAPGRIRRLAALMKRNPKASAAALLGTGIAGGAGLAYANKDYEGDVIFKEVSSTTIKKKTSRVLYR